MKTNLEKYAEKMSDTIKSHGLDCYHWSEVSVVIDELLKYADITGREKAEGLCFIGYTNGANLKLLNGTGFGAVYSDTKQNCYIPLYMLKSHLHRVETTSDGGVAAKELGLE